MDRLGRAVTARLTQGISPHVHYEAWFDWASHLAIAPGRLIELGLEAVNIGARFAQFAKQSLSENVKSPFEPQTGDRRFNDERWKQIPFWSWQQAFLAQEAWCGVGDLSGPACLPESDQLAISFLPSSNHFGSRADVYKQKKGPARAGRGAKLRSLNRLI